MPIRNLVRGIRLRLVCSGPSSGSRERAYSSEDGAEPGARGPDAGEEHEEGNGAKGGGDGDKYERARQVVATGNVATDGIPGP